jgi:flagellin-like hook-associated protein FlgL
VSSAKEIAIAMADGTYDNVAREASANEVKSLLDQIVSLANSELEGRKAFAGFQTKTKPFVSANGGVTYLGDTGSLEFEVEAGQRTTINLNGQDVFLKQLTTLGNKADLNVAVTGSTLLASLNSGSGVGLVPGTFTITDRNLNITSTVDLTTAPAATTINDALAKINAALNASGITNLTVGIGGVGNALALTATQNGLVSGSTQIARLNNGNNSVGTIGKIRVSDSAGINASIDLSGSTTLNDVITKFNTQIAAAGVNNVSMSINATGRGLEITDSNGVPLNLTVSNDSALDDTASRFGITGSVGATLVGTDLNPQVDFVVAETTGTAAAQLGINGEYTNSSIGRDLNPRVTTSSRLADLNNGLGVGQDSITFKQGNGVFTLNLGSATIVTVQDMLDAINGSGLAVTASINAGGTGIQVVNNDATKSFTIEETAAGRAAKSLGLFGSSDLMGTLIVLDNALRKDDQEGTGLLLEHLDSGIQNLLNYRATVGARGNRLDTTDSRLSDMKLSFTKLQSEVEDADMTTLITDLATYENSYKAALQAASMIIQPSLLDFLK